MQQGGMGQLILDHFGEMKATLVGQIARALTIFGVDEVVVFEDQTSAPPSKDAEGCSWSISYGIHT